MEIIQILKDIGLTLAVGSSTFALIFYFQSITDGIVSDVEKRFLRTVFRVLRIGMAIVIPIEIGLLWHALSSGTVEPFMIARSAVLGIIVLNAFLMQKRLMPMRFGPAIAGGSWYSYFGLNVLPLSGIGLGMLFGSYAAALVVMFLLLEIIRRAVVNKRT